MNCSEEKEKQYAKPVRWGISGNAWIARDFIIESDGHFIYEEIVIS